MSNTSLTIPPDGNPLTEDHLAAINAGLEQAVVARRAIALAERAGIDVAAAKAQLDINEAKLKQVKQVYFPNR